MNPRDGRRARAAAGRQAVRARHHLRRRARHQAGPVRRGARRCTWTRRSSPRRSTRRRKLLTGVVVNRDGKRFVAEDSYHSRTSGFVLDQPGSAAFLIVDSAHMERPGDAAGAVHRRLGDDRGDGAGARHPGGQPRRDPAALQRSRGAAARTRTSTSTRTGWSRRTPGPWGAFDLTLGKALYAGFTLGGLRVHGRRAGAARRRLGRRRPVRGRRVRREHRPGRQGYAAGTQLGEGSFFGRRAGRHAAGLAG